MPAMYVDPGQIASDWIAYARLNCEAPDEVFESAWVIYDVAHEEPELAWEAIKAVVSRYSEDDLLAEHVTEAKQVVGNTAAGPLESFLAEYGAHFIERVEVEARRDRKMLWALGCVWQNAMADDIWSRVHKAAGGISR